MTKVSRRHLIQVVVAAPFFLPRPSFAAEAIDEKSFVRIGGIDQWIAIQGQDRRNPAILFLHGGPGEAQSPFLDQFKPWERNYTVVNWDQRGAGKTYEKNGDATPDVTFDRLTNDIVELTDYVCKKLGKFKLILVAQSAGTELGLRAVQRRPDLFYAFVATGQVVNDIRAAEWQEKQTTVPPTHDAAEMKALHQWAIQSPPDQPYITRMNDFIGNPASPNPAAATWVKGFLFEAGKLNKETGSFDAMKDAPQLKVPYILIQGREDRVTPFALAKAYFDNVKSEGKAFIPIEGGHYACFTNPFEFVRALNKRVLPLAS